ncbi:MAG: S8 family serine peptidase [Elusimicrobia bacterium]|nr:S8 family serine peptidase [Elusimicrobiota bacterium]
MGDRGNTAAWEKKKFLLSLVPLSLIPLFPLFGAYVPDEILIKWSEAPAASTWTIPGTGIAIFRVKTVGTGGWELWKLADHKKVETALPYVAAMAMGSGLHLSFVSSDLRAAKGSLQQMTNEDLTPLPPAITAYATNDYRYPFGRVPNDPMIASQWHLDAIRAYAGWDFEVGASNPVTIAVIDTGVDITHVELSSGTGKIWTNPGDPPGGGDQDANGKTDDCAGWDFADEDGDARDCLGHGTLVASVAAASTDNGTGVAGVNWKAKILPLKIFPDSGCNTADSADIVAAIDYAVWLSTAYVSSIGRMVINMSLGCPGAGECGSVCSDNDAEKDAISRALAHGVLVVAAKGNCGDSLRVVPSDYSGVIGVGAVNRTDSLASFSNYGSGADLVAPGSEIFGAAKGGGYSANSGTSFSAPQAAAAAGLILSVLPAATKAFQVNEAGALRHSFRL